MDSLDIITEQQGEEITVEVSQATPWNRILCVDHSYEDYERKLINGEISFSKEENPKKDFTLKSFQRMLIEILGTSEQKVFHLSLPEDVIQRIDDVSHRRPFKTSSLRASQCGDATCDRKLIKKQKGTKPMTFIVVGSLEEVKHLKSQFPQRHDIEKKEETHTKQEINDETSDESEKYEINETPSLFNNNKRILDCDETESCLENSSFRKKRKLIIEDQAMQC